MKKKKKNKYIPFRKTILPVLSILMIVVAVLLFIYTIDNKKFNKEHTNYDKEYVMHVLYLIMDKDVVPSNITMEQTFNYEGGEFPEGVLGTVNSIISLNKKGDYLYVDLDTYTHPELLKNDTDYVFTKYNLNGEKIDGCEYDYKENVIKVPVSYFEENKFIPIQAEIQTIMSKEDFDNLKTNVNVKKLITKKIVSTNNAIDEETSFELKPFGLGRLSKKNLHIYINNADEQIPDNMYDIVGNDVRIRYPSILISKLDVKVDFSPITVKAHTTSNPNNFNAIKVTGPINKHVGDTGSFNLKGPAPRGFEIKYCGVWSNDVCIRRNGELLWDPDEANWSYTYVHTGGGSYSSYSPNGNYSVLMNFSVSVGSLVDRLEDGVGYEPLTGGASDRVAFYCYNHNYSASESDHMNIRYKVISETSHSVTIQFWSSNYYRSQDANAYLRFEWDNVEVGLRTKKVDDSGNAIQGLNITAVNMSNASDSKTATTDANGIATFASLTDGAKYKFYEDCNSTISVAGHNNTTLEAQGISCVYPSSNPLNNNGSGYTPTEDYATATPVTMENIKYRHCVTVHKTKGTNNRNEKGAEFQLSIPAGVCSLFSSSYTSSPKATDANGIASFTHLGYCTGTGSIRVVDSVHSLSVIGDNPRTVNFVRSQIKSKVNNFNYRGVTYNSGAVIPAMTNSDFVTNESAGKVEEICPTNNQVEVRDKDYVILWTKKDMSINNGQPLNNITFNVKLGSTPIRVYTTKENYTDTNNVTKLCYKYTTETGSNTTADLKSDGNGETCIFNLPKGGDNYTITEANTNVYSHSPITITSSESYANKDYINYEYIIDFNKKELTGLSTSNSGGNLAGAKFTVKDSRGNVVRTKATKETRYDNRNPRISKSCYVVDLVNGANNTNSEFVSDSDGYVCIVGVNKSETYTITEVDPAMYYGYSNSKSITEESKLTFNTTNPNPKMIYQCPTEVKITKTTTELNNASNEYKKVIYSELQKLTFNILDSNGNVLTFKYNPNTKHYEYQKAINDLKGTNDAGDSSIRLLTNVDVDNTPLINMNLNILVNYLPEGTYTLREVSSINCGSTSTTPSSGSNCTCDNNTNNNSGSTTEETSCSNMGYAHVPDISFTVTDNNTSNTVTCNKPTDDSVKVSLTNKPTEVKFTKKDFYGYFNDVDTVKFENDEEIEAFDNIIFKVRKQRTTNISGTTSVDPNNYEWFYKTGVGEYRLDVLHKCSSEGQVVGNYTCTQNLYTENGSMKLTHLCKCESYYIEEYEVPDGTVFTLPKLEGNTCDEGYMKVDKNGKLECHPVKSIKVCDCDDSNPESSPPVIIEDLPTKQVFIKKDLKYNTIITDQRLTFELFLSKEGKTCNPYDSVSKENDCIQVYFKDRVTLDDPDGSMSYRLIPETSSNNKIKELKVDPNTGKLILRYLPSYIDREYVLMETVSPKGYNLPTEEKSVTRFKVVNDTVNVEVSNVPNRPSKAIIGKYDASTGELIPGFKFKVYKVNNYDENLTPMMQSKSDALMFKTIRDGSYEYREVFDTDLITTCKDVEGSPCSNINSMLVNDTYEDHQMGINENLTTIKEGQALIQYLDQDSYYIVEEIEAPKGYKLPERESDRYTMFYVPVSEEVTVETKVYNTENYFTFFKYDEYNNVIDGAVFKLQKLNKEKIYEDIAIEDVSTDTTKMYKVLSTSENYEMTTLNGQATIYRLTEGQYRVIEIKAPDGYELPKKTYNVVTFLVDKNGHTFGSNIVANKKKTTKTITYPTAQAELVINIQTGKKVIKYGLIITGILGLVGLLIFIRKRFSK